MRFGFSWVVYLVVVAWAAAGCRSSNEISFDESYPHYRSMAQTIDYPDHQVSMETTAEVATMHRPPTVRRFDEIEYVGLSLEDAIRMAIDNNETVRQAGGMILRSPTTTTTIYDAAIQETDPRVGVEAALSAFDAEFNSVFSVGRRERQLNFTNPDLRYRQEQYGAFSFGLSKTAATGTQMRLDQTTAYLGTNVPFNRVPSIFDTMVNATVRHPLLQGGGIEFNRIAGPGATPGNYRGVLIARVNNDVALVDFQTSVRNLLRDVERGYWELYFAYRDLDAKIEGRRQAWESWDLVNKNFRAGNARPDQEANSREQYYAAQSSVENAISGERAQGGIFGAERELRSLLGLPAVDGKLFRPTTRPLTIDVQFDWEESLGHGLSRREEVRRQRWKIKQREMELIASRNFALPQLNAIGQYTFRGGGDDLLGQSDASLNELLTGNLQGWMMGVELTTPVGRRAGYAAVRNAELWLRREQALLLEQERQIGLELRAAFTELDRAYVVARSSYNRHVAAQVWVKDQTARYRLGAGRSNDERFGDALLDLLEAQRRSVQAEVAFHRAIVDYNQALSAVNLARGTLFESLDVYLTEGPWSAESHDSAQQQAYKFVPRSHHAPAVLPPPISAGEYPQRTDSYANEPSVEILPPVPAGETLQ